MKRTLQVLAAVTPLLAFTPALTSAQSGAPVVAVLVFDNTSIGKDARDFDGIGKGVMDILITDLSGNSKVRVVDRERINKVLEEQNLTKGGAIDGQTAVRVGKIFGACYSIYGAFMRDLKGENTLTVHTTNNETSQIQNPTRVTSKGDDVMALIAEASTKFVNGMDVKACPGTAGTTRSGDAGAAGAAAPSTPVQQSVSKPTTSTSASKPAPKPAASKPAMPANADLYAKQLTPAEKKKLEENKLDARTMLLYSRALDAQDRQEKTKAVALYQQVVAKYPNFEPASKKLAALRSSGD